MSIIYEALKKVGKFPDFTIPLKVDKESRPLPLRHRTYLVYGLVAALGFLITSIFWAFLSKPLKINTQDVFKNVPRVAPQNPPVLATNVPVAGLSQEEPLSSLVLNGVFFSQDEGYALINNQIVKEGDTVEGVKVLRIGPDEVDLDAKGSNIKLSINK